MSKPKQRADTDDNELFFADFDAGEFIDDMEGRGRPPRDSRPARQRLELRSEERWLKQQLSDWDDFDPNAVGLDHAFDE